jgi:hypothetical protein
MHIRVLVRSNIKRPKKHVATTMTCRLREIFLVKCQKRAFSFNKREAKVYCYAFLHVLNREIHDSEFQKCPEIVLQWNNPIGRM